MNIEIKNKLIIISSPSGAGKTTICKFLLKKMNNLLLSVSYTSRKKRPNEINKKDYFFISKNKFQNLERKDYFIETAKNFDNLYGSPFLNIRKANKKNKNLLFDIDWKGARKIRKKIDKKKIIDIFILPPSKLELKKRLIKRGSENKNEIKLRLSYAYNEMKHYKEYKYVLINDNVNETINKIINIINYNILIEKNNLIVAKNLKKIIDF